MQTSTNIADRNYPTQSAVSGLYGTLWVCGGLIVPRETDAETLLMQ